MTRRLAALLVIVSVTVTASAQHVQNTAKGFAADKTYDFSNVDSISIFNGNLTVPIPIGRRYVVSSTLSYQLFLTYNGNVWDHSTFGEVDRVKPDGIGNIRRVTPEYAYIDRKEFNAGLGWRLSLGWWHGDTPTYVTPDGSDHAFRARRLPDGSFSGDGATYTDDGSYLRRLNGGPVEFPDGTIHEFDARGG